jgi:D-3-phosphoglycerate dehydrogenase
VDDPAPAHALEQAGLQVVRADPRHHHAELAGPLAEAVAWVAGIAPVTAGLLDLAPGLRVLARYGVGVDAVDLAAAARRGLWVTNTPGANTDAVADFAVALMLDALRHVTVSATGVARGDWRVRRGHELGALTVGLIGLGRIGQAVARRVQAFGASVLASDPMLDRAPLAGVELVSPGQVAERADVVSLHAPGGATVVDAGWLEQARPGLVLVNTARGDLVDEPAMATALRDGRVASYACDVLVAGPETSGAGPLQAADLAGRVLITPHIAGQTAEAVSRMGEAAVQNVLAVLRGERPPNPVGR